jgi:hypothetical protein
MANNFLEKSLGFARQAKHANARFYLNLAKHWIQRLLRTKTRKGNVPDEILEDAIEDQSHALELKRINQIIEGDKEPNRGFLVNSQDFTLKTAEPFFSAVIEKEIREFPGRCQCKPWNKVIPLFEKGREAAEKSLDLIRKGERPELAMKEQEKAIKYWKEALEKLRHPDEEEEPPPQPEQQPEAPTPPPEPEESTSIDEVMKLLQQMDQDDRRPEPTETTPQQGLRPW